MTLLLIILLTVPAYAWLVFPLLLFLLTRGKCAQTNEIKEDAIRNDSFPPLSFSVLLSAHNEEKNITARISNLIESCGELPGLAEILIGFDGCTDDTVAVATEVCSRTHMPVKLLNFEQRRGKVAVLKEMVEQARGDVLVFTDANTVFAADAVIKLLSHFTNKKTGGVVGRLVFVEEEGKGQPVACHGEAPQVRSRLCGLQSAVCSVPRRSTGGAKTGLPSAVFPEGMYWRWETRLKMRESLLDSCLGANGAIYAIRRELFWKDIPENTVVDDFVIGMKVRETGCRILYEPAAKAYEELPPASAEWQRRVRIGSGDFQALWLCRTCLLPRFGRFAWFFWSHKVLRWFTPHIVLLLIGCSVFALFFSREAMLAGIILAGSGVIGIMALFLQPVRHFISMQAALFSGFILFCRGNLKGSWSRTVR